jgi:hypothetical protein
MDMNKKIQNIVAKFAKQFNRFAIIPDKKKEYKRKSKHRRDDD